MSTIVPFNYIGENSEATPGLFNSPLSALSASIANLNANVGSGLTLSVGSDISTGGGLFTAKPSSLSGMVTIHANSNVTDYLAFTDSSNQRSNYLLGSHAGGTADGLNLFDSSGNTMIVAFSKQSVRFYQSVVGSSFDIGGATFNVRAFGALGDGVTDDTAAVQACLDAASAVGGEATFPPGTYSVTTNGQYALSVRSSVLISGTPGSWLRLPSAQTVGTWILYINNPSVYTAVPDVQIEGLGFDGNGVDRALGIRALYTRNLLVQRCQFKNFHTSVFANATYCIYSSGSTAPVPPSPFPWSTYTQSPLGWTTNSRFLENSFSSCSATDAIFVYYTDGATVYNNVADATGKLCYIMGWDRNVTIVGNVVQNVTDNGIRVGADESINGTDPRDMEGVTISGNVVRSSNRDGIRFSANKSVVANNICSHNTLSGIQGVVVIDSVIGNNVCHGNLNHGIQVNRSTVTTWDTNKNVVIIGNNASYNANRGIIVQGGGPSKTTAASGIKVIGNNASFNSADGIAMWDCDDTCEVVNNTVASNNSNVLGSSGGQGIVVTNDQMGTGTGGLLIAWNRVYDSRSTPTAMQTRGIATSNTTAGSQTTGCRFYYNDLSGTTSNITTTAQGIVTTLPVGTQSGSLLVGNRYNQVAIPVNLASNDTELWRDFQGQLSLWSGSAPLPVLTFQSETSLGFYRSGKSVIAQSYGTFTAPVVATDRLEPLSLNTISIRSGIQINRGGNTDGVLIRGDSGGNYLNQHQGAGLLIMGSAAGRTVMTSGNAKDLELATNNATNTRVIVRSGGTVDFKQAPVVSLRTLGASFSSSNVTRDEMVFFIGGASGASLGIRSGSNDTIWWFNSAGSSAATVI